MSSKKPQKISPVGVIALMAAISAIVYLGNDSIEEQVSPPYQYEDSLVVNNPPNYNEDRPLQNTGDGTARRIAPEQYLDSPSLRSLNEESDSFTPSGEGVITSRQRADSAFIESESERSRAEYTDRRNTLGTNQSFYSSTNPENTIRVQFMNYLGCPNSDNICFYRVYFTKSGYFQQQDINNFELHLVKETDSEGNERWAANIDNRWLFIYTQSYPIRVVYGGITYIKSG